MRGEAPQFKRCCFCLPLRRGLIGWGYAKLVLNMLTIAYIILISCMVARRYIRMRDVIILSIICVFLLTDVVFNAIFIVGGHRKSVKLLKISYIYNLVSLSLILLAHSFKIYVNLQFLYSMWKYIGFNAYHLFDLIISSGLAFCVIFVQIYFILLIRSEMIKLRHQRLEMQFSNHLASGEPQCTLHSDAVIAPCTGKDASKDAMQDSTDGQSGVTNIVCD